MYILLCSFYCLFLFFFFPCISFGNLCLARYLPILSKSWSGSHLAISGPVPFQASLAHQCHCNETTWTSKPKTLIGLFQERVFHSFFFLRFLFFLSQLIYRILSIPAVLQSDPVYVYIIASLSHIHIQFFPQYPPSSIISDWIQFPVLYSRISLLVHSKCNSLCLLIPNSHSIPLPPPPPWHSQVCSPNL